MTAQQRRIFIAGHLVALAFNLTGLYLLWHWFGWHAVAAGALLTIKWTYKPQ